MNIEFRPEDGADQIVEQIVIAGEEVGHIKIKVAPGPYETRCHAVIRLPKAFGVHDLIQGHGDTREEAVTDALGKGRQTAESNLVEIAILENRLNL